MLRILGTLLALAVATVAAATPAAAQAVPLKEIYQDGLIDLQADPGPPIEVVTTETVPGKRCKSVGAQFPVIALPASTSLRNGADAAVRGARVMRKAAADAGANAIVEFRTSTFVTRNGNPRLFMYGTLALCE